MIMNKTPELTEEQRNKLDEYLPDNGKTGYFETEVYRAACKINYDYYQNGFGNNWKNPFIFLILADSHTGHEILGSEFEKFAELKLYCVGCSVDQGKDFGSYMYDYQVKGLVTELFNRCSKYAYDRLNNLTKESELDMWSPSTWPDYITENNIEIDEFGNPDDWENQFEGFIHVIEQGWINFEPNRYDPEHDYEFSRFHSRRRTW